MASGPNLSVSSTQKDFNLSTLPWGRMDLYLCTDAFRTLAHDVQSNVGVTRLRCHGLEAASVVAYFKPPVGSFVHSNTNLAGVRVLANIGQCLLDYVQNLKLYV